MRRIEPQDAVRPLTVQPDRRTPTRRLPVAIAGALLLIGASAGYLLGLPSDTATPAAPPTTTPAAVAPDSQLTPTNYDWLKQEATGPEQQAWAVYAAVELGEHIYMLVADDPASRRIRVLWRSDDGVSWDRLPLGLGDDAAITDLDVYGTTLLLSGWAGEEATVWRSQDLMDGQDPSWTATTLPDSAGGFGGLGGASTVTSEINTEGEIVVSATMELDITSKLLALPADGAVANLLAYRELPEIAVAGSRLWMRVVTATGAEETHTETIPPTLRIVPASGRYGTEVPFLTAGALWVSAEGESFEPVDLSEVAEAPTPQAFGDIFVSVTTDAAENHQLLTSADGYSWSASGWAPPIECGDWQGLATGGPGLLLTNDTFDTMCLSRTGTDWEIRPSTSTAVSTKATVWLERGGDGYLAIARNSAEFAVLRSSDGFHWDLVQFADEIVGIRTFVVGDRLLTSARPYGTSRPRPLVVWVGEPSDR